MIIWVGAGQLSGRGRAQWCYGRHPGPLQGIQQDAGGRVGAITVSRSWAGALVLWAAAE